MFALTVGQRGDGRGEPIDADNVCLRWMGNGCVGCVRLWHVHICVGSQRAMGVEVVEASELGFQPGLGLLYRWMWVQRHMQLQYYGCQRG